jgi:hypothetical protein
MLILLLALLLQGMPTPPPPTAEPVVVRQAEPVKVEVHVSDLLTSGGIVTVLGAIGLLVTTIFTGWAAFKAKTTVDGVKTVNDVQSKKLDNITVLVDGRYGEVLQELADVKDLLAATTGTKMDRLKADKAQTTANAQHDRTKAATDAIAAGEIANPPANPTKV